MFRKIKMVVALLLIMIVAGAGLEGNVGRVNAAADSAQYDVILTKEAQWISALQFETGAIPTFSAPIDNYGGKYKVVPYFTHFGLLGLLENPDSAPVVRRYMDWYFAHLNRSATVTTPAGSVYDYVIETDKQTETSTGDFDSTDSYASTFLDVVRKYVEVTGDTAYVQQHKSDILLIAEAMIATQQSDGLTWAKPSYPVKYLMDNSEVFKGLNSVEWLCETVFGDTASAAEYRKHKEDVYAAIQGMWSDTKGTYAYAKMNDDTLLYPDWNSFYADATSQLFPIWAGILAPDSERALHLYNTFNLHHPGWPQLNKSDAFPWAIIAYTAALIGDQVRVDQFLKSVKTSYIDQAHPWPWYVMESGTTMLAAAHMKKLPDIVTSWSMSNLQDGMVLSSLPYSVKGTAEGVTSVEMKWTNVLTGQLQTFQAAPSAGSWQLNIAGLSNGSYQIDVSAKDRFANVITAQQLQVSIQIAGNDPIAKAVVVSDRDVLRRGETTELKVNAYRADGTTPVDLNGAKIVYYTDHPELVSVSDQGVLTLLGMKRDMNELNVWAFITKGYDLVKTDTSTLKVSHEPLTMADDLLDRTSAWIADRQLLNGGITSNGDGRQIVAQFSNIAAQGLLLRAETIPYAKQYIDWYTSHWNWGDRFGVYGSIYDFRLNGESASWNSTGDYDSASATIGSFLSLVKKNYEKTGQLQLSQYQLDVLTGGIGIMRSQDSDGLMWRRPGDDVKRLDQNGISYQGMTDSVWLFQHHFDASGPANYFSIFADALRTGIQNDLWNESEGSYSLTKNQKGEKQLPVWSVPGDAVAQLAPIYNGVIAADSEAAKQLYAKFNQYQPDWALSGSFKAFASAAYAASIMGDEQRSSKYLGRLLVSIKNGGFPDGWTVEQAGYTMLAADLIRTMPSQATVQIEKPGSDGSLSNGVSQDAKGNASGAEKVRVELRERFGTSKQSEEIAVQPNGKWHISLKSLKRGVSYELTVSALDPFGYPIYGVSKSVTFKVGE